MIATLTLRVMSTHWMRHAECAAQPKLPWIAEATPGVEHRAEMGMICAGCPVRGRCAERVVERLALGRIIGGFYAGVWLPWPPSATPTATTVGRRQALDSLRRQAIDSERTRVLADQEQCVGGSK